ncbi:MAG TPA: DUF3099 domain-containing protein [Beutenbergiaceae bacterium]|nr:DUF3099 domain-containing protein [Beutenbergiaceae bacterium]
MREVHSITAADESLTARTGRRMRRYVISMGIRVGFFGAAFLTEGWVRWVCVAGAVVLPTIAVILGNESVEPGEEPETYLPVRPELADGGTDSGQLPDPSADRRDE